MKETPPLSRSKEAVNAADKPGLLRQLEETKRQLDMAYAGFNQSTDPDLIEFYLYQVNALRARHTYLLRQIKTLTTPQPAPEHDPS